MADAWELLIANSSLVTGDAWEHLNAQEGGGAGFIYLDNPLVVEIDMADYEVEVDILDFEVDIDDGYVVDIDIPEYEIEID